MKQLLIAELYSDDLMMILNQNSEQFREEIALQLLDHLNYTALELIKERAEECMEALYPTKKDTAKVPEMIPIVIENHHTNYSIENDPCSDCQYNDNGTCKTYMPCVMSLAERLSDD